MEILTNILTEEQFRGELHNTAVLLSQRGITQARIAFGFAPDFPNLEDVGVEYTVSVLDVPSVVEDREQTKGFPLGLSDCWLYPVGLEAEFLFCNDRDIHLKSESMELIDAVRNHWRTRGFNVYPDDLDGSVRQPPA